MRDGSRVLSGPQSTVGSEAQWRLAVEVKPKWGFLPSSPFLTPHTATVKRSVCRFCMHQLLKLKRGQSEHSSAHTVAVGGWPLCDFMSSRHSFAHSLSSAAVPQCVYVLVGAVSNFCPLDLYSCEPGRVHRAVAALLHTPHNNLRLFVRSPDGTTQVGVDRHTSRSQPTTQPRSLAQHCAALTATL